MENASKALEMAAAVLIFIVAIACAFSVFGHAKNSADAIMGMRDKQAYLDSAEVSEGILYTSLEDIESDKATGINTNGDRIVNISDVFATILRYNKEKYGVTIVEKNSGVVKARFDSNTENVMRLWYNIKDNELKKTYADRIAENTITQYCAPKYTKEELENLYAITGAGDNIKCGAPWYGNDTQIQKRIAKDIEGKIYEYNGQKYQGKNLLVTLMNAHQIIEVTNEIDRSKYLKDGETETDLLQQYEMPTVEVVYIYS